MFRLSALVFVVTTLAGAVAAIPASAAPSTDRTARAATHDQGHAQQAFESTLDLRTLQLTERPLGGVRVEYDRNGKEIKRVTIPSAAKPRVLQGVRGDKAKQLAEAYPQASSFACFETGNGNPNFIIYPPQNVGAEGFGGAGKVSGSYLVARYDILNARQTTNGEAIDFDTCTVGSWKTNQGYQQLSSGVALTAKTDPVGLKLIVGSSPGVRQSASVSSGISINATWGPVSIGATIPTVTSGTFTGNVGAYNGDFADASFQPHAQNEVNAWWHDGTLGTGTSDPVGETDEALYEINENTEFNSITFSWSTSFSYACFNPVGCG